MSLAAPQSEMDLMFDLAPVSLWLEDYSALKVLLDQWRAEGVEDLRSHLNSSAERRQQCASRLKVLQVNQRTLDLFKASSQIELVSRLADVFRDEMTEHFVEEMCQLWEGKLGFANQSINYTLNGERLDVLVQARVLPGHETTWSKVLLSLEDITARVLALEQLRASEKYARQLFELSPVSLWVEDFSIVKQLMDELRQVGITDFATFIKVHPEFVSRCIQEIRVIDVNQLTLKMFGASSKHMLLSQLGQIFRDEMHDSFTEQLLDLWEGKTTQHREVVNYSLNGDRLHIHMQFAVLEGHQHRWDMVQVSLVDITARKKAEAYLEYLGKHDVLTGLRNRAFFNEETNRLARKGPWPVTALAIDVNGLKSVNDEQGHAAGDAMLRRAGEVLRKAVDLPSCACRVGGDEFVVLMPATDPHQAEALKERILSLLELNNQFYPGQALSLSMGAATCERGQSLDHALQLADQRMYLEKARHYAEHPYERRRGQEPL